MIRRWLLYLVAWAGCLIFYYAYGQWLGWVFLAAINLLPVFSLLLSLPVMLSARLQLQLPKTVAVGEDVTMTLTLRSFLPLPRWQVRILAYHPLSGKFWLLKPGGDCPTEHCGGLEISFSKGRIYDYLGLFCLKLKTPDSCSLTVLPTAQKPAVLPDAQRQLALAWQPKPGGGYSEHHELRLYRPGDNLRQIHWKLSGKTGKLILRQSMEPRGSRMTLWLYLQGDADTLDRKLGTLRWLSQYLLDNLLHHDVLAYTGNGAFLQYIDSQEALDQALEALLRCPSLDEDTPQVHPGKLGCHYFIGGDAYETP